MEILKLKVVEREGKKEIIEIPVTVRTEEPEPVKQIPVTVRTEEPRPERQFEVKIQKDAPLKQQEQSKIVIKNMDEYEATLLKAKHELYEFKKRYSFCSELQEIFDAIDKI